MHPTSVGCVVNGIKVIAFGVKPENTMTDKKPLILDLNIPYCVAPEKYTSRMQLTGSNEEKNACLMAMMRELSAWEGQLEDYEIYAIRLGGGSATVMKPDLLGSLLAGARKLLPVAKGAEVSFDAHPLTIGTPSLTGIAAGHPNRAELYIHSQMDSELQTLGCSFSAQNIQNSLLFFNRFHMKNIGLSISYGIPGQTGHSWNYTLMNSMNVDPAHITVNPLGVRIGEDIPSEEERFAMFETAHNKLTEKGYNHYGKGFFAKPGYEHTFELYANNACEILGIGPNARTFMDGYLTRNTNNVMLYMQHAGDFEKQTADVLEYDAAAMQDYYISRRIGMTLGLSRADFEKRFGAALSAEQENALSALCESGLLTQTEGGYVPTLRGLFRACEG